MLAKVRSVTWVALVPAAWTGVTALVPGRSLVLVKVTPTSVMAKAVLSTAAVNVSLRAALSTATETTFPASIFVFRSASTAPQVADTPPLPPTVVE